MKYYFLFHKICDDDESFESISQIEFEHFCSAAAKFNKRCSVSEIIITFDDGFKSDLVEYKIARLYGLKTIHFIVHINTESWFVN